MIIIIILIIIIDMLENNGKIKQRALIGTCAKNNRNK